MSFLDVLLAGAIAEGLARRAMREAQPPPENFFEIPPNPEAWRKVLAASKEENMVICLELTDDSHPGSRRVQSLYMDLAREVQKIPFFRAKVTDDFSFAGLREDLGGLRYCPTIAVVFFPDDGTAIKSVEGEEGIRIALRTGTFHKAIKEFIDQRMKLKLAERMAEQLAGAIAVNMMVRRQQYLKELAEEKKRLEAKKDDSDSNMSELAKNLGLLSNIMEFAPNVIIRRKDVLDLSGKKK